MYMEKLRMQEISNKIITIITVTYNAVSTLGETIKSVVDQKNDNIEYIIIDGLSKDGTMDVVAKYHDNIDVIISEPDGGIYSAMNKGINFAKGDYIYFLGADDILVENSMTELMNALQAEPDILFAPVYFRYKNMCKLFDYFVHSLPDDGMDTCYLPPHQGMLVKKKIMKKNLFDCKYKLRADYKLELQLLNNINTYDVCFLEYPIAYYNVTGQSNRKYKLMDMETQAVLKELGFIEEVVIKKSLFKFFKRIIKNMMIHSNCWEYFLRLKGWKRMR